MFNTKCWWTRQFLIQRSFMLFLYIGVQNCTISAPSIRIFDGEITSKNLVPPFDYSPTIFTLLFSFIRTLYSPDPCSTIRSCYFPLALYALYSYLLVKGTEGFLDFVVYSWKTTFSRVLYQTLHVEASEK